MIFINKCFVFKIFSVILCLFVTQDIIEIFDVYSAKSVIGVSINEICTENNFYKAPDGTVCAWAEIYNASKYPADISGWGFSDDPKDPYKFSFPANVVLQSGERKIIFCDTAEHKDMQTAPLKFSEEENMLVLTNRFGKEMDRVTFGKIEADTSYGQYPDGSGEYFNMECTPDKNNISPNEKIVVDEPTLSHESGFYDNDFMLSVDVPEGTTVYYTLDGSEPSVDSTKYNANIRVYDKSDSPNVYSARTDVSSYGAVSPRKNVDKAFVIRAVAVDETGRKSKTITAVYFLGKTNSSYYKDMKVVSLVTDPDNLFNYNTGIYIKGKIYDMYNSNSIEAWNKQANYTQKGKDWEREAVFEVFDKGEKVVSQNVGIRIKGATSRSTPQKSFNIYARDEYGNSKIEYDFFDGNAVNALDGKVIEKYDSVVLRNAGNDTAYSYLRDNINQKLVSDRNLTMQAMNECIVFIDGEFWGFYTLTEKTDDSYIKNHYGIKKKNVAIIKNSELEEGMEEDLKDWNSLIKKSAYTDMTVEENYKEFCSKVDIDSLIEYFSMQIYWCNSDWPWNNFAVWHSDKIDKSNPYSDGKWRMFLFDTDFSTGLYKNNDTVYTADVFRRIRGYNDYISLTFTKLLRNPDFKNKFCITFMDMANCNFSPERTDKIIDFYRETYRQQILDTCERFYASSFIQSNGVNRFDSECDVIKDFYENRFIYASDSLKNALGLDGSLKNVTVKNNNKQGSITINTITPDFSGNSWNGQYFSDYSITLKAEAKQGYKFVKWEISGDGIPKKELKTAEINVVPESDLTIKAVYK